MQLDITYSKIFPSWSTSEFPRKSGLKKKKKEIFLGYDFL